MTTPPTPARRRFGARLKERREALGLSQSELGERVGVSANTIRSWERAAVEISAENMADLVPATGLDSADELWPGWAEVAARQGKIKPRRLSLRLLSERVDHLERELHKLTAPARQDQAEPTARAARLRREDRDGEDAQDDEAQPGRG